MTKEPRTLRNIAKSRRARRERRRTWLVRGGIAVGACALIGLILFAAPGLQLDALKQRLTTPSGE